VLTQQALNGAEGVLIDWSNMGDVLLPVVQMALDDIASDPRLLPGVDLRWAWADE
jgi:hypothetical protein